MRTLVFPRPAPTARRYGKSEITTHRNGTDQELLFLKLFLKIELATRKKFYKKWVQRSLKKMGRTSKSLMSRNIKESQKHEKFN